MMSYIESTIHRHAKREDHASRKQKTNRPWMIQILELADMWIQPFKYIQLAYSKNRSRGGDNILRKMSISPENCNVAKKQNKKTKSKLKSKQEETIKLKSIESKIQT